MKQRQALVIGLILAVILIGILVSGWRNLDYSYAQQQEPLSTGVKITDPLNNETFPAGESLTIYGTAPYNINDQNCKVSITANSTETTTGPPRNKSAVAFGGSYDYSDWKFIVHDIEIGRNLITAKYSCDDNPNSISFDTIDIIGVLGEAYGDGSGGGEVPPVNAAPRAPGGGGVIPPPILPTQLIMQYLY